MAISSLLTLLTDFGLEDYYVAAVKGTILRLAPGCQLIDLSHQVPPGDVATASFLLAAAAPSFPDATDHLAVVDPGVGSDRRILAVSTGRMVLLGPDNGLLSPFFSSGEVRAVERPDLYLPGPGATFHGRDRFAPVAAALLRGEPMERLGPLITDPVRLVGSAPRQDATGAFGRVIHVDRFGNLVTDLPAAWLPPERPFLARVQGAGKTVRRRVTHYRELTPGEVGVLVGSLGTLELSLNGDSLALRWQVSRGALVTFSWSDLEPSPIR
jgi:S-adenosylmethionine hydrolase